MRSSGGGSCENRAVWSILISLEQQLFSNAPSPLRQISLQKDREEYPQNPRP